MAQSTIFVGVLRRETKRLVLDVDGGEQLVLGPASICGLFADGLRVVRASDGERTTMNDDHFNHDAHVKALEDASNHL